MKKKTRIKWGNISELSIFIICSLLVINTFITLVTSISSLSYYGVITTILALIIIKITGEYLYNEMQ